MSQPLRLPSPAAETRPEAQPPLIALLRLANLACRAEPRAAALSRGAGDVRSPLAPEDHAARLAGRLPDLMLRRPVLWRPGAPGRSFDESWLVALQAALHRGDGDSVRFLTRARVRPAAAAELHRLLGSLAKGLETAA